MVDRGTSFASHNDRIGSTDRRAAPSREHILRHTKIPPAGAGHASGAPWCAAMIACGVLLLSTLAFGTTRYIAQSAGTFTGGTACNGQTAIALATWNATSESAGDISYICGTLTVTGGSTVSGLVPAWSGASGNPNKIIFDTGAILQSTAFGGGPAVGNANGAIYIASVSYWTIDGQGTGIIQNTANGSPGQTTCIAGTCTVQQGSVGVWISNATGIMVQNLIVQNIYMDLNGEATGGFSGAAGNSTDVWVGGPASTITISNCQLKDSHTGIWAGFDNGTIAAFNVYGNTVDHHAWGISWASGNTTPGVTSTGSIHDNSIGNFTDWNLSGSSGWHTDGIIIYTYSTTAFNPVIYNNYFYGDLDGGTGAGTAHISVGTNSGSDATGLGAGEIFNNVIDMTGTTHCAAALWDQGASVQFYNNTVLGPSSCSTGTSFGLVISGKTATLSNNVFSTVSNMIGGYGSVATDISASDHNDYYNCMSSSCFGFGNGGGPTYSTLAAFQSATGLETNSVTTNPLLDGNYKLQSGSPAIGLGANLTSLSITALDSDKAGVARPSFGAWDPGAYQYSAPSSSARVVFSGAITISGSVQIGGSGGSGGPLTYSARTDNCVLGSESGCIGGRTTGEAGSAMSFLYRTTDTVPFANLAPANTAATDADFGTYMVLVTDTATQNQTQNWVMGDTGEASSFSQDDTIFIGRNNTGGAWLHQVIPSLIHSKSCTPSTPCLVKSQIHNGATDSTHLVSGGSWTFSGVAGETHVLYELASSNTLVYKDVINTTGAPSGWTLTRSTYVDFTSDTPVPCSVVPASYTSHWSGTFTVGRDGSLEIGSTGGRDWQAGFTPVANETFLLPQSGNAGNYGFQVTAVTGPAGSVEPTWCQTTACTVTGDGGVSYVNIGKLNGQGPGFDIFSYQPGAGCSYINTRIGKIYRGTGNSQPAGNWTTDDTITCARLGQSPPCSLGDTMTLHASIQPFNGAFGQFGATGGGALSCMVAGTCSCAESNSNLIGAWSAVTAYSTFDLVYYSTVWYQSKTNHTSSTTPNLDTTNWKVDDAYCYGYIWQKNSTTVRPCLELGTGRNTCDSHREVGYDSFYAGGKYSSHYWSQPMTAAGTANPGVNTVPNTLPGDRHTSYQNVVAGDKQPFLMFQTDVPTAAANYTAAGYGEVIAMSTDGNETMYRMIHNYGTGSSPIFDVQNSIGDVSQDGTLAALTTDMMGTRGSTSPDWASGYTYVLGDSIFPTSGNPSNIEFQATTVVGPAGVVEPTWSTCTSTCTDGGVTWTNTTKSCNNLRAFFSPATLTHFNAGDTIIPLNAGGDIFQAQTTGTTGATLPNWLTSCPNYGDICSGDGSENWKNIEINTCRGDLVILDLLSAHAAP